MKYLSEFFVPHDSFLETNILLAYMSFKLNSFLFYIIKIYALSTHSYTCQKKKCGTIFTVIWGV